MIIDIRKHFKAIRKSGNISRSEIEEQLQKAMSYLYLENKVRKLAVEKGK